MNRARLAVLFALGAWVAVVHGAEERPVYASPYRIEPGELDVRGRVQQMLEREGTPLPTREPGGPPLPPDPVPAPEPVTETPADEPALPLPAEVPAEGAAPAPDAEPPSPPDFAPGEPVDIRGRIQKMLEQGGGAEVQAPPERDAGEAEPAPQPPSAPPAPEPEPDAAPAPNSESKLKPEGYVPLPKGSMTIDSEDDIEQLRRIIEEAQKQQGGG